MRAGVLIGTLLEKFHAHAVNVLWCTVIFKHLRRQNTSYLLSKEQEKASSRYQNEQPQSRKHSRGCGRGEAMAAATPIGRFGRFEGIQ